MPEVVGADARRQALVVDQRGDSFAERVRRDTWHAELFTDLPPLLAEAVGVADGACRRWKDHGRVAKVRNWSALSAVAPVGVHRGQASVGCHRRLPRVPCCLLRPGCRGWDLLRAFRVGHPVPSAPYRALVRAGMTYPALRDRRSRKWKRWETRYSDGVAADEPRGRVRTGRWQQRQGPGRY